jgi:cytolysin-activating lysine-acyltransferase
MTPSDPGFKLPTPEYPDAAQIAAYGGFAFLFMRTPRYDHYSLNQLRIVVQPPIDLRFYHLHQVDGVPRAGITWGYLGPEAEQKIILSQRLAPSDWLSGKQVWIMDVIAPYGQGLGALLTRRFLDQLPTDAGTARFPRYGTTGQLKHVVEYRKHGNRWRATRLTAENMTNDKNQAQTKEI